MGLKLLHARHSTAPTYFAGPWVGEFGWELCCWQGRLRKRARRGDRIIVCSRPGHEALYEDFAADFVPFVPPPGDASGYCIEGVAAESFRRLVPEGMRWLNPSAGVGHVLKNGCPYVPNQSYIRFGREPAAMEFDVIMHARDRRGPVKALRNWPAEAWSELAQSLPSRWRVGWIGSNEASMAFQGVDLRGLPLSDLMKRLRAARVVVGPSSGPIHLAALCGVPHVVWSGNSPDRIRYRELWNPFQVGHEFIASWEPDVGEVLSAIGAMVQGPASPV